MNQETQKSDLTNAIFSLIKNQHPQTVDELALLAEERTKISREEIIKHILALQSQGLIKLREQQTQPTNLAIYVKGEKAYWYWATIIFALATTASAFAIPEYAYPFVYIRYVLGTIFVVWLPGYTLTRALFPKRPRPTDDSKQRELAIEERIALSISMSLASVALLGLVLNYTPWGIRLAPIVLSLFLLTIAFASAALIREHQ